MMLHAPCLQQPSYHTKEFHLHDSSKVDQAQHSTLITSDRHMQQLQHQLQHHQHHQQPQHNQSQHSRQSPVQHESQNEQEEDLNFHDYIHSKHDDERDPEESRSTISSPRPQNSSTAISNKRNTLASSSLQVESSDETMMQSSSSNQQQQIMSTANETTMVSSGIDHLYESTSHHYPPFDLVPPPTQDLFRTLMEELQAQAAIQRDQFLASSSRTESTTETSDYSINNHHSRNLPRFMMEPMDFLSSNYESYLEPGLGSHSESVVTTGAPFQGSFNHMSQSESSTSAMVSAALSSTMVSSSPQPGAQSNSVITSTPIDNVGSKKRQTEDENHGFSANNGTSTPPNIVTSHEELSPPTQDLFRMLMEELEAQAALQRDQALASTARSDLSGTGNGHGNGLQSTDFSFSHNNNQHQQHQQHQHGKLPRFVMDPFDFLSPNYGTMQVDNAGNQQSDPRHSIFMNSGESSNIQQGEATSSNSVTGHSSTSPLLSSTEEHFTPPNQDLFRMLMEELETQAAFQRDQVLAETTGTTARIDPEEYVFNGQHLRPLPRFMFEPLDFLTPGYESCFGGEIQNMNGSSSHQFVQPSLMGMDSMGTSSSSRRPGKQDGSKKQISRKNSQTNRYKTILPQRPKNLTISTANNNSTENMMGVSINPTKKRRVGAEECTPQSSNSLEPGNREGLESPVSPADISKLSISYNGMTPPASSPEGSFEGANATKRPWTTEDEALLLKLFAKRVPIKEIAQTLDRTVHSVRSRRQILTDPGFVKGKGHGVSRRCKQDLATSTKLPTYAQMAFLSLAWLPELEGTLNDVATMVEKLFSRHLNRIPRTGHKNLQIWRAQISDALAHEKGQPRPRFESFGVKRGRQWVYRLTSFGKGIVDAMGGVDKICQDLLRSNEIELAAAASAEEALDGVGGSIIKDADGQLGGTGADAGIGKGEGYGYSYRPPDARKKPGKRSRPSRKMIAKKKEEEASKAGSDSAANAIANAMEAMAAGLAKMMALEEEDMLAIN